MKQSNRLQFYVEQIIINLPIAVVMTIIISILNTGTVTWPGVAILSLAGFIIALLICTFIPLNAIGEKFSRKIAKKDNFLLMILPIDLINITIISIAMMFITEGIPSKEIWLGWAKSFPILFVASYLVCLLVIPLSKVITNKIFMKGSLQ